MNGDLPQHLGGLGAAACGVTGFLLLSFLADLVPGTGVFWELEGRLSGDPSRSFQRDKWELLQNYMCQDGPVLDLLIRVRGQPGGKVD